MQSPIANFDCLSGQDQSEQRRPRQVFKDVVSGAVFVVEDSARGRIFVPMLFPVSRFDGTHLLPSYIWYVNKPRAVRPEDLRRTVQQDMFSLMDSQVRLEAEIFQLLEWMK